MNAKVREPHEAEEYRQELLGEITREGESQEEQFRPGTFGCHELLDRLSILVGNLEEHILQHPSCVRNPDWFELAHQAVSVLNDLYQQVGASHLDEDTPGVLFNGTASTTSLRKQ